jgi:hypothetical protein
MRQLLWVMLVVAPLGACAVSEEPATSEVEAATTQAMGENWDRYAFGSVGGQGGWSGNCLVIPQSATEKFLMCPGGSGASKSVGFQGAGSFMLLADLSPDFFAVDGTHGKLFLEGPQGPVLQIIAGCGSIRFAFQMGGAGGTLATFPCQSLPPFPQYRVICTWSTGGTTLSCGASRLPQDPTEFVTVTTPGPMRPFDSIRLHTFPFAGSTLFDKIFIWKD